MSNFEDDLKQIDFEKRKVKAGVTSSLTVHKTWQPIAMEWFEKWKLYVNYSNNADDTERTAEFVRSLHPGEIDNSSLQGSYGDEMKRGLVENQDYVLLPTDIAASLFKHYGGGPQFPRSVLNMGTAYNPLHKLVLYPTRCEIYMCDDAMPQPNPEKKKPLIRYHTNNPTFKSAVDGFKNLHSNLSYPYRVWIKEKRTIVGESSTTADNMDMDVDNGESKRARTTVTRGRRILSEEVEREGEWKLLRDIAHSAATVLDILGEKDCIEIIIECVNRFTVKEQEWPRNKFIQQWKENLQVGDLLDTADNYRKWFVAAVKGYDTEGNLTVHYPGWDESFDEVIPRTEFAARVLPLHTHTYDRFYGWHDGTDIDIRVSESLDKGGVWIVGKIVEVDRVNEKVKVSYSRKSKNEALNASNKKNEASSATSTAVEADIIVPAAASAVSVESDSPMDVVNMDTDVNVSDDVLKQRQSEITSTSLALVPVGEVVDVSVSMTGTGENESESDLMEVWVDMYGDEIVPLHAHTPKPTVVSAYSNQVSSYTSSGTSSYSYGSYGSYGNSSYSSYYDHMKGTPIAKGMVGLQNLGNTCFMNSILQCLSCTYPLTQFFLQDSYLSQINYDNPLGNKGKVALAYAKLLREIWSNEYVKVAPRDFKQTIGEFQPQFSGYQQQDSQEFMNFLFDGLHEDLNRIQKKPFVQKIESKGRPDDLIASESWRRFLLRNDSELVDRCFGQLKSHVTCVQCGTESVTFEAYSSISLPIPIKNTKPVEVIVQLLPLGSSPIRVVLDVEVSEPMSNLKKLLIDRLVAAKVTLIPSLPATPAPMKTETEKENQSEKMAMDGEEENDDGFEVINKPKPRENAQEENGFDVISSHDVEMDADTDGTMDHYQNKAPTNETDKAIDPDTRSVYDQVHFHFAMSFASRPNNIHKNYNAATSARTAICTYGGKTDTILAFQLERIVPEMKSSPYAVVAMNSQELKVRESHAYYAIDLCIAVREKDKYKTMNSTLTDRLVFKTLPIRLTLRRGMTNHEVYRQVRLVLMKFIKASEEGQRENENERERNCEFALVLTNSFGTVQRGAVEDNEKLIFTAAIDGSDTLAAILPFKETDLLEMKKESETNSHLRHWDIDRFQATRFTELSDLMSADDGQGQGSDRDGHRSIGLTDCFDKFVEKEQLGENDTIYCSTCKAHTAPTKKMDIWSAPDILILHLKRFQIIPGDAGFHRREKITDFIQFPIEALDLSKYVKGPIQMNTSQGSPCLYDLHAVSHHMGGLGGGHYVATCKHPSNGKWYDCNDSSVSETTADSAVSATAYVLFYQRRNGSLKWGGITPHPQGLPDEDK